MSGPGVLALQRSLNLVADRRLSEDGQFGPATEQAVRDFQRFLGLGVDGIVGPQTRGLLLMALGRIEKGQA
jgi:peptidoglycan hydrolase-like protein with peptidoglycan-binding domain